MALERKYFVIDPHSVVSLYLQIQENLTELIELGLLRAGDALPSERELSQYYNVNRMTVRQAMNELVKLGLIRKQHGVGTFVAQRKSVQQLMPTVTGFSQRIREAGLKPSSHILARDVIMPSPLIAHHLRIDPLEKVIKIRRLRLVEDEALMIETSYLSFARFEGLLDKDLVNHSLYSLIESEYGLHVEEAEHTLEPTLLSAEEAGLFGLEAGQPAMLVRVVAHGPAHIPIEYSKSVVRGDRSRYYFRVNTRLPILT